MAFKNVPPPAGSKSASAYQRFIPREELGDFASWKPGTFGAGPAQAFAAAPAPQSTAHHASHTAAPAAAPAEPTAAEWQARITAARQLGYQEGYRDGLVALESFKQSFAQQNTAQVGQLLQAFDDQLNALDAAMAQALAQTAVQLARQVLRAELQSQPALVAQVASEAVGAVMLSARHISVQVHPQDLPLVAQGAEEILSARGARLSANPQIERGGVLVQSDVGNIDARIAQRWAQAAAALGSALPLQDLQDLPDMPRPAP
jgi:flagellar assembly protein FliH